MTELLRMPVEFNGVKNDLTIEETDGYADYHIKIGGYHVLRINHDGTLSRCENIGDIGIDLDKKGRIKKSKNWSLFCHNRVYVTIDLCDGEYDLEVVSTSQGIDIRTSGDPLFELTRSGICRFSPCYKWPKKALDKRMRVKWCK